MKGKKLAPVKAQIRNILKAIKDVDREIEKITGVVESWQDTVTQNAEAILSETEFIEDTRREALGIPSISEEKRTAELNAIRARYGMAPLSAGDGGGAAAGGVSVGVRAGAFTGQGVISGGGASGPVVINQSFTGEPNMAVAAQSAAWEYKALMSSMPLGATA